MSLKKVDTKIEIETTYAWIKRMAHECKKEMPLLTTSKIINRKKVYKNIDWKKRLQLIHHKGGKEAVRKYLVTVVQDYNFRITNIKKT